MQTLSIQGLDPVTWRVLSPRDRVQALQALEDSLARQENRTPAEVSLAKPGGFEPGERGACLYSEGGCKSFINPALVDQNADRIEYYADDGAPIDANEPYAAVHTLFHEDQHDHQCYVAGQRPDLAKTQQQVKDYQTGMSEAGYITPEEDELLYSIQPVEVDARQVAQERMDQLYDRNDPGYAAHRDHSVAEEMIIRESAEEQYGSGYAQVAREEVYSRAGQPQGLQREVGGEGAGTQELQTQEGIDEGEANSGESLSRTDDAYGEYYGRGY